MYRQVLIVVLLASLMGAWLPASGSTEYALLVSTSGDRSAPGSLDGGALAGNVFVFTSPDVGVKEVSFWVDDPAMSGTAFKREKNAPFDLAGTASDGGALPYDTTDLTDGQHTITAQLTLADARKIVLHGHVTVSNQVGGLTVVPSSVSLTSPVDGEPLSAQLRVTDSQPSTFDAVSDAAWLTVTPATGTTPVDLTVAIDVAGLYPGRHLAAVTVSRWDGARVQVPVQVDVHGDPAELPPDQIHLAWVEDPSTSMTVVWRSNAPAAIQELRVRPEADVSDWTSVPGAHRASTVDGIFHDATVTGLEPGRTYAYQIRSGDQSWSPTRTTRTAPRSGLFDFVYVADTGLVGRLDGLTTGTQQVIDEIKSLDPQLVLSGGDLAYFDTEKRFNTLDAAISAWFVQMAPVAERAPIMPTYGNHEIHLDEGFEPWAARFPTPEGWKQRRAYSFDASGVHFISVFAPDSSRKLIDSQMKWLRKDLQQARSDGARWIVPFMHVSPFADGTNHPSNLELRKQLGPLFEEFGVRLAIASHDQAYERTYPLTDVPSSNEPTTTSLACYEPHHGVVWAKVSPGGKLSNKNRGFSQFATVPAPPWTAVRDNEHHNFAHVSIMEDALRFEALGFRGDGSPAVLLDSFELRDTCGPTLRFEPRSSDVRVSADDGPFSAIVDLTTSGKGDGVAALAVDSPWLTVPSETPFPGPLSLAVDPTGLSPGVHKASVTADADGLGSATHTMTLRIDALSHPVSYGLLRSDRGDRLGPTQLQGSVVAGDLFAFTGPDQGVKEVRFWIDDPSMAGKPYRREKNAPFDLNGGPNDGDALAFDTRQLSEGAHTITAALALVTGGSEIVHANFTVTNG
jgi:hypothetical protein